MLNARAGFRQLINVAVYRCCYVPLHCVLLSARRNYKVTPNLSHLTVEEQFILRVSSIFF